jgi:stearoyl-CoA desaturase (delta-9 desaturase)
MKQAQQIRLLQLLNHIAVIVGLTFAFYGYATLLLYSIIIGIVFSVVGINIAYHRYLAHQSFQTYPIIEKILLLVGCLCLVGSPLAWAVSHINHHAYADKDGDPYSPNRIKLWDFLMTRFEPVKHQRLGLSRLLKNKTVMVLHNNYLKIIGIYCLVLCIFNPLFVIYFWCIPSVIVLYLLLATNIVCHLTGYRNHNTDDLSQNSIVMSILTLGEGWHNNHHANPSKWAQGERWFEFDPTAWIIRLIKT